MAIKIPSREIGLDIPDLSVQIPRQRNAPQASFGSQVAEATAEGVGKVLSIFEKRQQQKVDLENAQYDDAIERSYLTSLNDRLFSEKEESVIRDGKKTKVQRGLLNRQGINAKGSTPEFDEWHNQEANNYINAISDPARKQKMYERINGYYNSKRNQLIGHEVQEDKVYKQNEADSTIELKQQMAAQATSIDDFNRIVGEMATTRANIDNWNGVDDSTKELNRQKDLYNAAKGNIDGLMIADPSGVLAGKRVEEIGLNDVSKKALKDEVETQVKANRELISNDLMEQVIENGATSEVIGNIVSNKENIGAEEYDKLFKKISNIQDIKITSLENLNDLSKDHRNLVDDAITTFEGFINDPVSRYEKNEQLINLLNKGLDGNEVKRINQMVSEISGNPEKRNKVQAAYESFKGFYGGLMKSVYIDSIKSVLDVFDTQDVEAASVEKMRQEYNKAYPEQPLKKEENPLNPPYEKDIKFTPLLEKIGKGYGMGVAGMLEGVAGVAGWAGADNIRKAVKGQADLLKETYAIEDPDFTYYLSGGLASASAFMVPGIGIARGTMFLKALPRLASIVGISSSTLLESSIQAGSDYEQALTKGMSEPQASANATKSFWLNIPTLALTNAMGGLFGVDKGGAIAKALKSAPMEATQEFTQELISQSLVNDIELQPLVQSAMIGGIVGGGLGLTVSASDNLGDLKNTKKLFDDLTMKLQSERGSVNFGGGDNIARNAQGKPLEINPSVDVMGGEVTEVRGTPEMYQEYVNIKKQETLPKKAIKSLSESVADSFKGIDQTIGITSTRAANIAEELRDTLRKYEFSQYQELKKYETTIKDFQESFNAKDLGDDFHILDLALKNRDTQTAQSIMQKHGMSESYQQTRNLLNEFPKMAEEVGVKMGFIEDYFPRSVSDVQGLLSELRNDPNWNMIDQAVKDEEGRLGYQLSEDDKARLITQMLAGYGESQIAIGGTKFSKERRIDILEPKYAKYYKNSNEALLEYVRSMNAMIEGRKFFGRESKETTEVRTKLKRARSRIVEIKEEDAPVVKSRKLGQLFAILDNLNRQIDAAPDIADVTNIMAKAEDLMGYIDTVKVMKPESVKSMVLRQLNDKIEGLDNEIATRNTNLENGIGAFVKDLVENKTIPQDKVEELTEIIRARLAPKGIENQGAVILRDIGYFATLNDITNGITQLGDLFLSVYKNNLVNTLSGFSDVIQGKHKVTREDLGIGDIISSEYDALRNRDKANEFIIKYSAIKPFDSLGKSTFINASWKRMQLLAKKEDSRFVQELDRVFGDQADKVLNDIKEGNLTYDAKYLIFAELSNIQPISLSEVPENYLKAGNWRIAYMLKTFTLKAMDIARNDAYNEIRKGNYKTGATNLFKLAVTFGLMGATTGAIKDFILGRAFDLGEDAIDGLLQLFMFNRYTGSQGKKVGYIKAWLNSQIPPIYKIPDDMIKDITSEKEIPDWKSIRNIPLVGEPYYWWFGGGVERKEREESGGRAKSRRRRRE